MEVVPLLPPADHPGDTQRVELLGRNRLIDELLRDDLEVALPVRDRGVDLIAYLDLISTTETYVARPIQMKAAWVRSFMIDKRYAKFPGLLLAYVWHLNDRDRAVTYALSYQEALSVADELGWTKTDSWTGTRYGRYANSRPGERIVGLLEPFKMRPGKWWEKIVGSPRPPRKLPVPLAARS